jgi:hypothetical protein
MRNFPHPYGADSSGRTASPTLDEHVRQMIELVLFTAPGERPNRPDFGSGVMQLVFAPLSEELVSATEYRVQGALQQWLGDVVQFESVTVTTDESTLTVTVQYVLRQNQERQIAAFSREV